MQSSCFSAYRRRTRRRAWPRERSRPPLRRRSPRRSPYWRSRAAQDARTARAPADGRAALSFRALRLQPRVQGQQQSSTTVLSVQVTDATTAKLAKPPQIGSPVKPCTSREALRAMRTCEYSGAHRRREQSRMMGAIRESHSRRHSFRNKRRRLCPARQPAGLGASSEATYQH